MPKRTLLVFRSTVESNGAPNDSEPKSVCARARLAFQAIIPKAELPRSASRLPDRNRNNRLSSRYRPGLAHGVHRDAAKLGMLSTHAATLPPSQ